MSSATESLSIVEGSRSRLAAAAVFAGSTATILGAWAFEHIGGLAPCPMCLTQRWFHYAAIPLALVLFVLTYRGGSSGVVRGGLVLCALILLAGATYAAYHAGVEYHWWEGPQACSGGGMSSDGVLPNLNSLNVVSCTEAAWTLFGISLAGYNVLLSIALGAIALWGARAAS